MAKRATCKYCEEKIKANAYICDLCLRLVAIQKGKRRYMRNRYALRSFLLILIALFWMYLLPSSIVKGPYWLSYVLTIALAIVLYYHIKKCVVWARLTHEDYDPYAEE